MTLNFDKYAQTGNIFMKEVAGELGDKKDTSRAGRVLRATLHVLRDQSTPEESIQFISQLPMFIKAIYVDGWALGNKKNRVRHLDEFISAVQENAGKNDFLDQDDCYLSVKAVLRVIRNYVSEGEIEDIRRTLPEDLRVLFED